MWDVRYGQRCEPPQPNGYFTAHGTHPITQLVAPFRSEGALRGVRNLEKGFGFSCSHAFMNLTG